MLCWRVDTVPDAVGPVSASQPKRFFLSAMQGLVPAGCLHEAIDMALLGTQVPPGVKVPEAAARAYAGRQWKKF